MSLGCNIQQVKENAFNIVKQKVEGKSRTIRMDANGIVRFNYTNSGKYPTLAAAYNTALNKIKAIENLMSEQVGPKFRTGWLSLNQNQNEVWLQYSFPGYIENAYNRKFATLERRERFAQNIQEARTVQAEDAKRLGLDEVDDSYLYFNYEDDFDALENPDISYENLGSPDNVREYLLSDDVELESPEKTKRIAEVNNDFMSYYNHKSNLLKNIEHKFESYKTMNKSNYGSEKYKSDIYKFQNIINKLKDELETLDVKDINNVFSDVINEINYLDNILTSLDTDVFRNEDIIGRIEFLHESITGLNLNGETVPELVKWDGKDYPDYDAKVKSKIVDLNNKLKESQDNIVRELMNRDIIFQAHKDNFTEDEVNALFNSMRDINLVQAYFLGINSNNDSIVSTLLNTTFQTNVQKTKQFARPFNESLKKLDKTLKDKNFSLDNFLEKDDDNIDTGNIIHKYNKAYFAKLYEYYDLNRAVNSAKKDMKQNAYSKKIAWLKENTDLIDFRKISYFKEIYGDEYSEFFTSSDIEMNAYETELKGKLGKLYDYHIQDLEKKLAEYEDYRTNEELKPDNKWLGKNINSNSPWIFIRNYNSENDYKQVDYQSGQSNYSTFNNSRYIEFVPKRTKYDVDTMQNVDTGFYNKNFDTIENDNDAFSYWENIRELYSKHINPTYASTGQSISTLSWAKFERDFVEEMKRSEGMSGFFKNLFHQTLRYFRELWIEKGFYNDKNNIRTNYTDATVKEIRTLKKGLQLVKTEDLQAMADTENISYPGLNEYTKGLSKSDKEGAVEQYRKTLIDKIARKKILANYSTDLTKTTLALSELASLHKSRQETQYIADMLLGYAEKIKTKPGAEGKRRNMANKKLQSWVDTNIYNKRAVSRGNVNDEFSAESKYSITKVLSDTERDIIKILKTLKTDDTSQIGNYYFNIEGIGFHKKGNQYYTSSEKKNTPITKDIFERKLEEYINEQIKEMGISITPSGMLLGMMQVIINKALALNPVSGIFNRSEGMFSNMIRDNMGDFWTRGNLKYAKRFLLFGNINKFAGDQLSLQSKQKMLQMQTYKQLLDELALFQDKKNELDRKDKESKYNKFKDKWNIFQFAVDNPEFKNQSEIVLSMLMDVRIKDNNGKEYKFFDGTGFPAYKPGTLELRDEFKNESNQGWQDFSINDNIELNNFFVQKVKIEDTIKRTQGNYASLDSIMVQDTNWGKFIMLFMRWFPEHVNQRFGTRKTDIIQGKSKVIGRYRGLLGQSGPASIFATIALGATVGPYGLAIGAGLTIMPFVAKHLYGMYVSQDTTINDAINDLKINAGFLQEILVQTLNTPVKATYSNVNLDDKIQNKFLNNSKLTPEQIDAIKGMAQETGIMISQLMLMLLFKSLLYNADDDDDDYRRQLHNFVDNQGNRSINSLLIWSNPKQMVEDNSKLALLRYIGDIYKLIDFTSKHFSEDKGDTKELLYNINKVQPFIPIPSMVSKAALGGEVPGLDKREYQNAQWFDRKVKGQEWINQQILKNKRSEFKKLYEEQLIDKYKAKDIPEEEAEKAIEKQVNRRMRKKDIGKGKTETATEALERIDFDAKIEEIEE